MREKQPRIWIWVGMVVGGLGGIVGPGWGVQIEVVRVTDPITIDGRLDEPGWQRRPFTNVGGLSGALRSDAQALYLAFTCTLARFSEKPPARVHDDPDLAKQPHFAFVLQEVTGRSLETVHYFQFLVVPGRGWSDSMDQVDAKWDPPLRYEEGVDAKGRWTLEVRLPLDAVNLEQSEGVRRSFQVRAPGSDPAVPLTVWHELVWDVWQPTTAKPVPPHRKYPDPSMLSFEEKRKMMLGVLDEIKGFLGEIGRGVSLGVLRNTHPNLNGYFMPSMDLWSDQMDDWPTLRSLCSDPAYQAMAEIQRLLLVTSTHEEYKNILKATDIPALLPGVTMDAGSDEDYLQLRKTTIVDGYQSLWDKQEKKASEPR